MVLLGVLAAGCGSEGPRAQGQDAASTVARDALRVRTDAARGRLWVLGVDDVRVYDAGGKRLIRRLVLPGWSVARFVCNPDLALDRSGAAIISSNVQSRLWQVDGETFAVTEREIALTGRERWDTGFGALVFAGDGSLLALTANAHSLWKLDLAGARGSLVETYNPSLKACTVALKAAGRNQDRSKP
jgi:hypothetical protein